LDHIQKGFLQRARQGISDDATILTLLE